MCSSLILFSCETCGKQVKSQVHLKKHIYQIHLKKESFSTTQIDKVPCELDVCGKQYSRLSSLAYHCCVLTKVDVPCPLCKHYLHFRGIFKHHMTVHRGEKPHYICYKSASKRSSLKTQSVVKKNYKRWQYKHCGLHFSREISVKENLLEFHQLEKEKFIDYSALDKQYVRKCIYKVCLKHLLSWFFCDKCKKFSKKNELKRLRFIHSKIFLCRLCEIEFYKRSRKCESNMEVTKTILHSKFSAENVANVDKGGNNLSCGNVTVSKSDMNACESFFPYRTSMTSASKISEAYESNPSSGKHYLPCKRSITYDSELNSNKKNPSLCKTAMQCPASSENFANLHPGAGAGTQTSNSQMALASCGKTSPVRTVWVHVSDTKLSTPHTTVPTMVSFDRSENQNSNGKLKCLEASNSKNQSVSHDAAVKKSRSLKPNLTHEISQQKELRNSPLSEDSGQRIVSCIVPQRTVASNSNPKAAFPNDCSVITSQSKVNFGHLSNYAGEKTLSTGVLQSHESNNCVAKPQKYNACNQLPLHKKSVVEPNPNLKSRDLSYAAPHSTTSTASTSVPQPYIYSYNYDLSCKARNFQTPLSIGSGASNFQGPFPHDTPEAKTFQSLSPLNLGVKNVSQANAPYFEPNFNPNNKPLVAPYYSSDSYGMNSKNPPASLSDYKNPVSNPVVSQDCRMNSHAEARHFALNSFSKDSCEERVAKSYSGEHFYAQGYTKQYETKVPPELNSYVCPDGSQIIFHEGNLKNSSVSSEDKIIYLMFPEENVQNLPYQGRSCNYIESSNFPTHERNVIVHPAVNNVVSQLHPVLPSKQSFQSVQFNGKPLYQNEMTGVSLQSQQHKQNMSFETGLQPAIFNINSEAWHEGKDSSDSATAAAGDNSLSSEQASKSSQKTKPEVKSFSVDTFKKLFSENESQKPRPAVPQNVKSFSSETFLKEFSQKFK